MEKMVKNKERRKHETKHTHKRGWDDNKQKIHTSRVYLNNLTQPEIANKQTEHPSSFVGYCSVHLLSLV